MDLSKTFGTLNHELLLAKLNVYGFSANAMAYIKFTCLIDIKEPKKTTNSAPGKISIKAYHRVPF